MHCQAVGCCGALLCVVEGTSYVIRYPELRREGMVRLSCDAMPWAMPAVGIRGRRRSCRMRRQYLAGRGMQGSEHQIGLL